MTAHASCSGQFIVLALVHWCQVPAVFSAVVVKLVTGVTMAEWEAENDPACKEVGGWTGLASSSMRLKVKIS